MINVFINFIIKIKEMENNNGVLVDEYLVSYKENNDDEKDKFVIMKSEHGSSKLSINKEIVNLNDISVPMRYDINLNLDFDSFITSPNVDELGERVLRKINNI